MGERYRKQVAGLINSLNEPGRRTEAAELMRTLIDNIVFGPEEGSPKRATLDLHGDLAGTRPGFRKWRKTVITTLVAGQDLNMRPSGYRHDGENQSSLSPT
jgi:hypothetical protein